MLKKWIYLEYRKYFNSGQYIKNIFYYVYLKGNSYFMKFIFGTLINIINVNSITK